MQNLQGKTALGLEQNIGAMLCYIGNFVCSFGLIYSIIVVVTDKTSKLVRFHAWQSISLAVVGLIFGFVIFIVSLIAGFIDAYLGFPLLSLVVGLIALIFGVSLLIMMMLAAFRAYKGEIYKMPVIGNIAERKA